MYHIEYKTLNLRAAIYFSSDWNEFCVGSPTRDFFAWSCCLPCAVCQETRTLTKNNVEDGVWYGPTQLVQQIPPQQLMTQYDIPQKAIAVWYG